MTEAAEPGGTRMKVAISIVCLLVDLNAQVPRSWCFLQPISVIKDRQADFL